jgi:hypothetical protein
MLDHRKLLYSSHACAQERLSTFMQPAWPAGREQTSGRSAVRFAGQRFDTNTVLLIGQQSSASAAL